MAEIRVEGVTKRFGGRFAALSDVSFTVKDGEFVVLLGPSGCGKTTLLRCIAGLESVDQGRIYIGSEASNDIPSRDRDLSMVFQNFSLFPLMTVHDNIAFPLSVRGQSRSATDERVREVSSLLGIGNLLDKMPRQLSGGEQQRVAIGRAIARSPKAFLMDEPLSSLDAPLRAQLRSELKRIQREIKVTTLYVTHDQGEALALADRIGVMNRGTLLQYDSPQELFKNPSSIFVARFVGDPQPTLTDVQLRRDGRAGFLLEGDGFTYPLPEDFGVRVEAGKTAAKADVLTMVIRPEDVSLSRGKAADGSSVAGEARLDEPLTLYHLITVRVGNVEFKSLTARDDRFETGEKVWVQMNLQRIHLYDKKTGDRINI